jgi:beta-glucosidase
VIYGNVNPSGKLPISFPIRNEDNPAYLNYRSEHGRVLYGEDIYVGYRFYDATRKATQFPFGHGLSYTTFQLSQLKVTSDGKNLSAVVLVENTGERDGSEVIQVYVTQRSPCVKRPPKELKGFAKEHINVGQSKLVTFSIELKYATSYWDEERDMWVSEKDIYDVLVGTSSAHTPLRANFELEETTWWSGL